jgi:hypothetical protein
MMVPALLPQGSPGAIFDHLGVAIIRVCQVAWVLSLFVERLREIDEQKVQVAR